jgi:hypothetical protein
MSTANEHLGVDINDTLYPLAVDAKETLIHFVNETLNDESVRRIILSDFTNGEPSPVLLSASSQILYIMLTQVRRDNGTYFNQEALADIEKFKAYISHNKTIPLLVLMMIYPAHAIQMAVRLMVETHRGVTQERAELFAQRVLHPQVSMLHQFLEQFIPEMEEFAKSK